ncbi:thiopurine S-methyltransferase [Methylomonas methanica]|uniref:Thiopurine S-methyltransferase n=1 Tax=Methylomonas methanica (strain DSM 25384 / MC09) TaxID=857087 RepID=F9ZXQ9_METMM|nr:thiopurine S-methyltransferase [Methylomonas methanica]AEG02214.1 Thiopurine S-methyltransferase [Methylomonas methanica MC09]
MQSRDNVLWLQCWRDRQIDFHQQTINEFLPRFWPRLDLASGSRVFVPLCGKSLDMIWLAEQGHQVIGVELSPIAVADFFRENGLKPNRRRVNQFTLWQHGRISILCGDYFALKPADLGEIETVYDRAALTALPEDIRKQYVSHLCKIVPDTSEIFLLTTEDAAENETLGESLEIGEEITALYSQNFRIDLTHIESIFELDPDSPDRPATRAECKLYRLSNRAAA